MESHCGGASSLVPAVNFWDAWSWVPPGTIRVIPRSISMICELPFSEVFLYHNVSYILMSLQIRIHCYYVLFSRFEGSSRILIYDHRSEFVVCIFIRITAVKSLMIMKHSTKRSLLTDIHMRGLPGIPNDERTTTTYITIFYKTCQNEGTSHHIPMCSWASSPGHIFEQLIQSEAPSTGFQNHETNVDHFCKPSGTSSSNKTRLNTDTTT